MNNSAKKKRIWDTQAFWVVVSLFSAMLIWLYVTSTEGVETDNVFRGVAVEFKGADTLLEKNGLAVTNVSASNVTVTIKSTMRNMSQITADNIKAVIDLTKNDTNVGWHTIQYDISYPAGVDESAFTVVYTSPRTIQFFIDKTNSKTIELRGQFEGTVADGFATKDPEIEPGSVIIRGPQNEISEVAYGLVVVDRQNVDKTIKYSTDYKLMDADGNELELKNVTLDTETVMVTLPVTSTKEVPLDVDLIDGGGASRENVKITCVPDKITIAGDAQILEGINKLSVGTVDLSAFESTFEDTFTLVLDNEITNVTGINEIKVTVEVIGLETKKFNVTNISMINVPSGRTGTVITENVEVILRGSAEALSRIKSNNIRAVVDLQDIGNTSGVFQPSAKIHVDGFTGVGAIKPASGDYKIYVKIT